MQQPFSLEQVMDRDPLVVAPATPVVEVIDQMSQSWVNWCSLSRVDGEMAGGSDIPIDHSCVLVVANAQLLGIFTERDIVQLTATGRTLERLTIADVMARQIVTLKTTDFQDIFTVLGIWRQHHIRHLPVVDEHNRLVGLISLEGIRRALGPVDLLRLCRVEEVMSTQVIHVPPTTSALQVAQVMAQHQVTGVLVAEEQHATLLTPIGIITERDIVQFQRLELVPASLSAQAVMSTPLFFASPEESLWAAHQQMEQHRVRHLAVVGPQGELRGMVTQTNILQVLEPIGMYRVLESSQRKVQGLEEQTQCQLQRLRKQEEQLRLSLQAARMGIWDWDIQTDRVSLTRGVEAGLDLIDGLFETNVEAILARIDPEDREPTLQAIGYARTHQQNFQHEFRVQRSDGSIQWIEAKGKFFYDETGQASRMLGTVVDISERKQAEIALQRANEELEARVTERTAKLHQANEDLRHELAERQRAEATLQESERQWRSLHDNVRLVVIGVDREGRLEYINPFALELTGYTPAEVLGQNWFERFVPQSQRPQLQKYFWELLQKSAPLHYRNPILTKSGEERIIAWNNVPLRNWRGEVTGVMSIGEDVTERLAIERMKDEFLSVVSHELRTPLTSVHGFLQLLSKGFIGAESERGQQMTAIAAENSQRLVRLINDILDLDRLESGKIRLEKQPVNTADLTHRAIELTQLLAEQADIHLEVSDPGIALEADGDRLIQALTNLLDNAIKFSQRNSTVWLRVAWARGEQQLVNAINEPVPTIVFTVKDQGRGIPADQLDRVFERFNQVDASDSRQRRGTGLGLSICRNIVEQHGGRIWVESTLGEGSCFYFALPIGISGEVRREGNNPRQNVQANSRY